MPKRRANGEGNIRKRKDGRWEGATQSVTIPKPERPSSKCPRQDAGRGEGETEKAIEENVGIDYGRAKTSVGEVGWRSDGELRKSKTQTVHLQNLARLSEKPHQAANRQRPAGRPDLSGLTTVLAKHLLDGGRVDRVEAKKKPKGLAPKTVRNIHQMIGSAYNLAMEQKLVSRNPTQGCAPPKVEHKEMKTLTADQLSAFFQEAKDSGVYELYYLDLATGLRRGELLGLKWTDVDLDRGVLKIQRAISRQNGQGSRSTIENEKRLSNAAPVGRRDRRSDATKKKKNGQQRMGIPHRPPEAPCHRTASCTCSSGC